MICKHKQLERSCEICDLEKQLVASAVRLEKMREALRHSVDCFHCQERGTCEEFEGLRKAALSDSDLSPTVELLRAALAWADVREELSNTSTADPKLYDSMATAERQAREYLRAKAAPLLAARRKEKGDK